MCEVDAEGQKWDNYTTSKVFCTREASDTMQGLAQQVVQQRDFIGANDCVCLCAVNVRDVYPDEISF